MKYWIIAVEIVIVQPLAFARPAGLMLSASPSSADATAAPAREVEIAPEPGRNSPPAAAGVLTRRVPRIVSSRIFIRTAKLPQLFVGLPAQCGSTGSRSPPGSPR